MCEPFFGEAIPKWFGEIASTGRERQFRNDTSEVFCKDDNRRKSGK
jgi:hypothetical protein